MSATGLTCDWIETPRMMEAAWLLKECFPGDGWTLHALAAFRERYGVAKGLFGPGDPGDGGGGDLLAVVLYTAHKRHLGLRRVAVRPDRRREGLGRAAVELAVRSVFRPRLRAVAEEDRLLAHQFLRGLGFRVAVNDRGEPAVRRAGAAGGADLYVFTRARVPLPCGPAGG